MPTCCISEPCAGLVRSQVGETLTIGGATVLLVKKSGQLARLLIEAAPDTQIKPPARMSAPEPVENTHAHMLHQ